MLQFTHLLMEAKSKYSPNIKPYLKTHDIIDSIDGFSHITLNHNMLPPIRIKTKPSIFIMKRKSNIKYEPNKARSRSSVKMDFGNQVDDKNIKLNTSLEKEDKLVESVELEKVKETVEQNFSDIELETKTQNDIKEKKVEIYDLADDNMTSMESTTSETESINKLSTNSKDKHKENVESQEDFKDVSDISDMKPDEQAKNGEESIIKEKSKNSINLRQESQGVKETVKKMIQEKRLEAKQKKEVNGEQKNIEVTIKPMKKRGVTSEINMGVKHELKESPVSTNKSVVMEEKSKITKEHKKDDEFSKQKPATQKKDKIKVLKSYNLEQTEDMMEEENKIVDVKADVEKIAKSQDKIDAELQEAEIVREKDKKKNVKTPKSTNVRESIRNIINQFKEFEKDFIHDDIDTTASINDPNRTGSDSKHTEMDSAESSGQLTVKDARESLKEIIDQFKYIKHELTSQEDDQFDEIAAKYMERPIAETLTQFSEALKALIQRRKKTSSKEHAANLHDKDLLENQRKSIAEQTNVNSNINTIEKERLPKFRKMQEVENEL